MYTEADSVSGEMVKTNSFTPSMNTIGMKC